LFADHNFQLRGKNMSEPVLPGAIRGVRRFHALTLFPLRPVIVNEGDFQFNASPLRPHTIDIRKKTTIMRFAKLQNTLSREVTIRETGNTDSWSGPPVDLTARPAMMERETHISRKGLGTGTESHE
jgi:hypothetical protein